MRRTGHQKRMGTAPVEVAGPRMAHHEQAGERRRGDLQRVGGEQYVAATPG